MTPLTICIPYAGNRLNWRQPGPEGHRLIAHHLLVVNTYSVFKVHTTIPQKTLFVKGLEPRKTPRVYVQKAYLKVIFSNM